MKTRKIIATAILATTLAISALAQPDAEKKEQRKERIQAEKIAFITTKLNLSPEEAQIFWPVYNEYQQKLEGMQEEHRKNFREKKKEFEELSDKEVEELVDGEITFRQKKLDIQKRYHARFKEVLPIKKVARLYHAERKFKEHMIKRLKEHKKDGEQRQHREHR